MTTHPNAQALSLLEGIAATGRSYAQDEPGAREKLLSLTHSLTAAVELPSEAIQRMGWAEPARSAVVKIAGDLKLLDKLAEKEDVGLTAAELATESKADPILTSRIMRHLVAMNVVSEKGAGHFVATPFSTALTEPMYRDGITYNHYVAGPSFYGLPAYLKSISYAHPTDTTDGPFQYAHKTSSQMFAWLYENPALALCFNNYMTGYRAGKPAWVDPGFYPMEGRLGKGMKQCADEVLLVDVGGGMGHDLKLLKQKYPQTRGRLILQDKEEVIRQQISETGNSYEKMAHDFFTPQPVKGARAYHLHSVLHDWDDASCLTILRNIASAMIKGYSKLLINELIVPDKGASWSITSMDWLMLALAAAKERTEENWRDMVERAGLRITGIWTVEQGTESLIECELA